MWLYGFHALFFYQGKCAIELLFHVKEMFRSNWFLLWQVITAARYEKSFRYGV